MTQPKHPDFFPMFTVNTRVRFRSEKPEDEPVGTIVEVGYCALRIQWDDGHPTTTVLANRLNQLEAI